MVFRKIRLKPPLSLIVVVLFGAILASLHLMSNATQDSSQLGEIYSKLLLINTLGSILLLALVVANIVWLVKQLRRRAAGSALTARMVFLFLLLTLTPASIVFYYSMMFLQRSIDSWFDVRIDQAMDDALKLGQAAVDERIRAVAKQTEQGAKQLEHAPLPEMALLLDEIRSSEESDLTIFSKQGRIIASSSPQPSLMIPDLPDAVVLLQVKPGKTFTTLEPGPDGHLQVRALALLADDSAYFLQAVHPLPLRLSQLAETVESAYIQIKELGFLRNSLKQSFSLTLSLVLLLSLLAAIWVAFISIRRLVAPVRHLAQGTRAVAEGRYEQRLPVKERDELGFLVESFNSMTASLSQARDEAHRSRMEVERQRAYLETVLANLSSGVMSFDARLRILTANHATDSILHATLSRSVGLSMGSIERHHPHLADLLRVIEKHLRATRNGVWQVEVSLPGPQGTQELLCRGTQLFSPDGAWQGAVVVLDDVTALIQAQRQAAWSEVARRLAHEIKNPLTPIQLSAERLKIKLGPTLGETEAAFLERSTRTIVQQVEAMKTMVNAFAEYARPAVAHIQRVELNALIEEVVALYPPQSGLEFHLELESRLPATLADPGRIRQVLHNLIKNAQEASSGKPGLVTITTRSVEGDGNRHAELLIGDNGPGIPADQADRIFEPYVTTKSKGTGLGLAIVKKIIEEHGGQIRLESAEAGGAAFLIRLPSAAPAPPHPLRSALEARHD